MRQRRIAVYGGSFNPFGNNHTDIVRWLVEEGGFRTVIVVPAAAHALKSGLPEFMHRYNMAKLGLNHLRYNGMPSLPQDADVRVSMIEMDMLTKQTAPIRTYELLNEISQGYSPNDEIKFAIGPDIPEELHKWHNVDKIEAEYGFVHLPIQSMRATKLREMISNGVSSWHRHVPLPVRKYIERHNLYHVARTTCEHEWEPTWVQTMTYPHKERCTKCQLPKPGSECESWHKAKAIQQEEARA